MELIIFDILANFASFDGKLFLGKLRMFLLIQDGNRYADFVHVKNQQNQ